MIDLNTLVYYIFSLTFVLLLITIQILLYLFCCFFDIYLIFENFFGINQFIPLYYKSRTAFHTVILQSVFSLVKMSDESVALGLVIYSSVKPIFKIYFIIGVGFWLAKKNILNVSTCRDISDTVVTAILPCLVFDNVVTNLKSSDIKNIGIIFFTCTILSGTGIILAYILSIITRSPKRWLGGLLSVGLFPNISDLPIAYLQTLANGGLVFTAAEGDLGVAYVCIFLAAQAFYQFTFGLFRLVEWDFRDQLKDEENSTPTSATASDASEKNDIEKESKQTSIADSQSKSITMPEVRTPEDRDSYDEELSISSSISEQHEVPPPLEIGSSDQVNTHTSRDHDFISQTISGRSQGTRRDSITSILSPSNLLRPIKSKDLRIMKSQDIGDVIHEYSEFDNLKDQSIERLVTGGGDVATSIVSTKSNVPNPPNTIMAKIKKRLLTVLKNILSPVSMTLIISLAVAMAPPLKALFVHSTFDIPDAPDGLPPLSFIIDITSYIGAASVPLGLLLLGATIARLKVGTMPPGFWKTALGTVIIRLVLLPIIGVGLTTGFDNAGWYEGDKLIRFVSVLEFGLPNATSLVYFTAFFTDPNSNDHIQMDCLAACLIFQYAVLFISLPILISFTIKVSLGF